MKNDRQRTRMTRRQFVSYAGITVRSGIGLATLNACGTSPSTQVSRPAFPRTGNGSSYTFEPMTTRLSLGEQTVSTWAYNGGLPGPEIRVNAGDTLRGHCQLGDMMSLFTSQSGEEILFFERFYLIL